MSVLRAAETPGPRRRPPRSVTTAGAVDVPAHPKRRSVREGGNVLGMETPEFDVTQARGLDKFLGFNVSRADGEGLHGTLEISEIHHQPFGLTHGGVYCALAESAASISAFCWLQESGIGGSAVGANNSTDFLRASTSGTLTVTTTPIHRGRRQQLWQVDITGPDEKLIAQSRVRLQNIPMPTNQPG